MSISDAFVIVTCDKCGVEEQLALTSLAQSGSWDQRNIIPKLDKAGWIVSNQGRQTLCFDCAEERP